MLVVKIHRIETAMHIDDEVWKICAALKVSPNCVMWREFQIIVVGVGVYGGGVANAYMMGVPGFNSAEFSACQPCNYLKYGS